MKLRLLSAMLLSSALSVGIFLPAMSAASTHHNRSSDGLHMSGHWTLPAAAGKVTTTGANTFTVTNPRSSAATVVDVTGTTAYTEWGVTTPSFTNVQVGDYVVVLGTTASATVTATSVVIMVPRTPPTPPAVIGKVSSVGTNTFTVTGHGATVFTVNVTGTTTYTENSVISPTFASITTSDFVSVQGTATGDTVAATAVRIFDPSASASGWGKGGHGFERHSRFK